MSSGTSDLVATSLLDIYVVLFFYIPTFLFFCNYYSVRDITGSGEGVKRRTPEKFYGYNIVAYDQVSFTHTHTHTQF